MSILDDFDIRVPESAESNESDGVKILIDEPDAWLHVAPLQHDMKPVGARLLAAVVAGDIVVPPHPPLRTRSGASIRPKRNTAFFSDDVRAFPYSGVEMPASPLTPDMVALMEFLNGWAASRLGSDANPKGTTSKGNGFLVQDYGDDGSIGTHRDDPRSVLGGGFGVVAVSLGAPKPFRVSKMVDGKRVTVVEHATGDGEILWMGGSAFQPTFVHDVRALKSFPGRRVSFTLRYHHPERSHYH
jgi:alkylated DNA repair dioxygenase AlkB